VAARASLGTSSIELPHAAIGSPNVGVQVGPLGGATVADTTVRADIGVDGAGAVEPGPVTLRRSVVQAPFGNEAIVLGSGANVLEDSLVVAEAGADGVQVTGSGVSAEVRNLTVIGKGAANGFDVDGAATTTVKSTVVRGFATAIVRAGSATVSTDYSHVEGPVAAGVTQSHPVSGGPGFADEAGGDYRPRDDSPLIDAGDPAGLADGESPTDLAGAPRIVDFRGTCTARRDVGAYERQAGPRPPRAVATAAPAQAGTGQEVTFDAAGSCDPDGGALTYAWTFDDGGSATGQSVRHAFAAAGPHTGTVTVTDPSGATAAATASVSVLTPTGRCVNLVTGSAAADVLSGSRFGDLIRGLAGNDRINGRAGRDCLLGGAGRDSVRGGSARDVLRGQSGNDTLSGGGSIDRLVGSTGRDRLVGGGGADGLAGGASNDSLAGGSGNDSLVGGAGNDRLAGGSGVNRYSAGAGNDRVNARNRRRDRIDCGRGRRDGATVDRRDRVRRCERVRRR
jgi:Ca2+-binding RTX toxin-like protein